MLPVHLSEQKWREHSEWNKCNGISQEIIASDNPVRIAGKVWQDRFERNEIVLGRKVHTWIFEKKKL